MFRKTLVIFAVLLMAALPIWWLTAVFTPTPSILPSAVPAAHAAPPDLALTAPPLLFAAGQQAGWQYEASASAHHIAFTADGLRFALTAPPEDEASDGLRFAALTLRYLDAAPHQWTAVSPTAAIEHRYIGNDPAAWQTDLPLYAGLRQNGLYPGIDLLVGSADGHLKSDFYVAPGADPGQIRFYYEGAQKVWLDDAGYLWIETAVGPLIEEPPIAWQEVDGRRRYIPAAFTLDGEMVAIALGDYDPAYPLIIDPILTYFNLIDSSAIASDAQGNVYVADGALQIIENAGGQIIEVRGGTMRFSKISPEGLVLYRTTVSGSRQDYFMDMVVDGAQRLFFSGQSNSGDFPVTANAVDKTCGNDGNCDYSGGLYFFDAVFGRLGVDGRIEYASYWGGGFSEFEPRIAIDLTGMVYIAGFIRTPRNCNPCVYDFPTTPGVHGPNTGVAYFDTTAFVSKFDLSKPPTQQVQYSTLVRELTAVRRLAVDNDNRALLLDPLSDITFLNAAATALDGDIVLPVSYINQMLLTPDNKLYLVGDVSTPGLATPGAPDTTLGGAVDGFVARINLNGGIEFFTYIGGSGADYGRYLALYQNRLTVAGFTLSNDFPTLNPLDPTLTGSGKDDIFLINYQLTSNGATVRWATYLGGDENERLYGLAHQKENEVWLAAEALDATFFPRQGRYLARINGLHGLNLHVSQLAAPNPVPLGQTLRYTVTVANYGSKDAENVVVTGTLPGNDYWTMALSSHPMACSTNVANNSYQCNFATLNRGQSHQLTFSGPTLQYGVVTHTVQITGTAVDGASDVYPQDNLSVSRVNIRTGLAIGVSGPAVHRSGDPLTHTIVITNYGPEPMNAVTFDEQIIGEGTLPNQPRPVVEGHTANCSPPTPTQQERSCYLINPEPLPPGTSVSFKIPISTSVTASGNLTYTVTINGQSAVTNLPDPDISDNSATVITKLEPPGADLAVSFTTSSFDGLAPAAGRPLTYTVVFTNYGSDIAQDVIITTTIGAAPQTFFPLKLSAPNNPNCAFVQIVDEPARHVCRFPGELVYANTAQSYSFSVIPMFMGPLSANITPTVQTTMMITGTAVTIDEFGMTAPTGYPDPDPDDNIFSRAIPMPAGYDLAVNLGASHTVLPYQEPITLTASLRNLGVESAAQVTFTVGVPISLTYNSHTADDDSLTCAYNSGTRQLVCAKGILGGDGLSSVRLNVTPVQTGTIHLPLSGAADRTYSITLFQARGDGDTGNREKDPDDDSGDFPITVENDVKLVLLTERYPADGRVGTGDRITYTVRIRNDGPRLAQNSLLTMSWGEGGPVPLNLNLPEGCTVTLTTNIICALPTIPRGQTSPAWRFVAVAPAEIDVSPKATTLNLIVQDTLSKTPTQASIVTHILRKSDLRLTLSDSQDPAPIGKPYQINVGLSNLGPFPAAGTVIKLNAIGYSFNPAILLAKPDYCTGEGTELTCALGALPVGESRNFQLSLMAPPEPGSRLMVALVESSDVIALRPSASESTAFRPERTVTVSMVDSPDPVEPDQRLTLAVTLHNQSAQPATQTRIVFFGDYPLQNVTFPAGLTCQATQYHNHPTAFRCTVGELAGNSQATYTFQVTAPRGKSEVTHHAHVELYEINLSGNAASAVTQVRPERDMGVLEVTAVPNRPYVVKGQTFQYQVRIHNHSGEAATNVTVQFNVTNGVLFQASGAGFDCSFGANNLSATCLIGAMGGNETLSLSFGGNIPASSQQTTLLVSAQVSATEHDGVTGNNSKAAAQQIVDPVDLLFENANLTGSPAGANGLVELTIDLKNNGPGRTQEGAEIRITHSPNLQIQAIQPGTAEDFTVMFCANSVCSYAFLESGKRIASVKIIAKVIGPVTDGDTATITLTAVDPGGTDSDLSNNVSVHTIDLTDKADLSVRLERLGMTTLELTPGRRDSLVFVIVNRGPAPAENISAALTLPEGFAPDADAMLNPTCAVSAAMIVDCTFPFLAQDDEKWVIISVKPPANLTAADVRTALYSVASDSPDPNPGNNNGAVTLPFVPKSDLSLSGQAAPSSIGSQETAELLYTIANAGPSDAAAYQLNLGEIGNIVAFVSADNPDCAVTSGNVSCNINTPLPVGQSQTIRVTVRGEQDGDSQIVGTVAIANDPDTNNNNRNLTVSVSDKADLTVTGGAFPSSPNVDIPLIAAMTNLGPNDAALSQLQIIIPAGLSLIPGSVSGFGAGEPICTVQTLTILCNVLNLPSGGITQAQFTVRADNWTTQNYPIQLTAVLGGNQQDPNLGNNTGFITVQIHAPQ